MIDSVTMDDAAMFCLSSKHVLIKFSSNHYLPFALSFHRFTTKMDASGYTLQPNELPSFKNSMPNVPVVCGTRRFGIIVVRIWQIGVCV